MIYQMYYFWSPKEFFDLIIKIMWLDIKNLHKIKKCEDFKDF